MDENPFEWPSLENVGVAVPKTLTKGYSAWWLERTADTTTVWQAYEKLDGTNVAMIASSGSLLGRHFKIPDDAVTYQSAPLANVRAHIDSVKAVEQVLLKMLPEAVRGDCQAVLYGELLVNQKHGYHHRTEPHRIGDWFIFGAAIVGKDSAILEDSLNDIRLSLLQQGLAAKQQSKKIYLFLTDAFAALLQNASAGKLRTPQPLCPPCRSLYDIVTALEPQLTGEAALNTEGAILVGTQGQQRVEALKYKTGHSDDSASGEKLSQLLGTEAITGLGEHTLKLIRAMHAVATAHTVNGEAVSGRKRQGEGSKAQKQEGQEDQRFRAAFDSALTKVDAVSVWSADKEQLGKTITYITEQVKAD